ncbi:hypothetical protein RD055328_10910 [Companilactobacillus sp. RD055328]|nr:hypothetical protein RD055328_10910 [Companilactobacillus sp. RD055328]
MSDILEIRVRDVLDKDISYITEKKTGKTRSLYLIQVRDQVSQYVEMTNLKMDDYLFISQRGDKLSVNYIYKLFQKAADALGRSDIGTHTLRKTFGYHYYKKTKDIGALMIMFQHSDESITKRYIGITDDQISNSLKNFSLIDI